MCCVTSGGVRARRLFVKSSASPGPHCGAPRSIFSASCVAGAPTYHTTPHHSAVVQRRAVSCVYLASRPAVPCGPCRVVARTVQHGTGMVFVQLLWSGAAPCRLVWQSLHLHDMHGLLVAHRYCSVPSRGISRCCREIASAVVSCCTAVSPCASVPVQQALRPECYIAIVPRRATAFGCCTSWGHLSCRVGQYHVAWCPVSCALLCLALSAVSRSVAAVPRSKQRRCVCGVRA